MVAVVPAAAGEGDGEGEGDEEQLFHGGNLLELDWPVSVYVHV
jgi:hypothetical protein